MISISPADFENMQPSDYFDRAYGFWLGQIAGNLFGLPHEMKYIDAPAPEIVPFAHDYCDGGFSDDDTDIEWMYLYALEEFGIDISYEQIAEIWKRCIVPGQKIWVANRRARELMDQGIVPPKTSDPELNPASTWNISGQFTQEIWGALCPAMPHTAKAFADKFARVAVCDEAAYAAHYVSVLNSLAFAKSDLSPSGIQDLVELGVNALPEGSQYRTAISDAMQWWSENRTDWHTARARLHEQYFIERKWNQNSAVLNGAAFTLGLLYGDADFDRTIRLTCTIGYDADCNAATVGGLLGILYGSGNLPSEWTVPLNNTYRNTTRINLPESEEISSIAERTQKIAEQVIIAKGGEVSEDLYRIKNGE